MDSVKYSNFQITNLTGQNLSERMFYGTIDETTTTTTGYLWWKKTTTVTEKKKIAKKFVGFWFYVVTGEYTPNQCMETLCRAWEAQHQVQLADLTETKLQSIHIPPTSDAMIEELK